MSTLPLADLEAFAAVAGQRNFRKAALMRGTSASSLSEAVRRLETKLGIRLLNRTTRSVTPTDAGRKLLERLSPALAEIAASLDLVGDGETGPAGTLRLNVPSIVGQVVLPGLIARFLARYPAVSVEISISDSFIDVFSAGFDAGIRYGERLELDMIAVPVGPRQQRYVTVASRAYLAAHGRPGHPRDVLAHRCIRHRFQSGLIAAWEFDRDGETTRVDPDGPLIANTVAVELEAALGGIGLMHGFEEHVAAHVRSGALEQVLEDWSESFPGPYLYYPSRQHMPSALRAFIDFIKAA